MLFDCMSLEVRVNPAEQWQTGPCSLPARCCSLWVLDVHLWEAGLWMPEGPALPCSHQHLCSARHGFVRLSCEANHCPGSEEPSKKALLWTETNPVTSLYSSQQTLGQHDGIDLHWEVHKSGWEFLMQFLALKSAPWGKIVRATWASWFLSSFSSRAT